MSFSGLRFAGLSAFPLTPLRAQDIDGRRVDERALEGIVHRLVTAGVDSIGVLGSTGAAMYLDRRERRRALEVAIGVAGNVPVIAGVSALGTREVLWHVDDAQCAGAAAVMVAPVRYTPLTDAEVVGLYDEVSRAAEVPIVVYDNPATTGFTFTDDLYARIAELPGVASFKIPGVPAEPAQARARIDRLRERLPAHVTVGVSGDPFAAAGLAAGCDGWYSAVAGTLPRLAQRVVATAGDPAASARLAARLRSLWELFAAHGSLRVIAAIAEHLRLVGEDCLPRPILGLDARARAEVARTLGELGELDELGELGELDELGG